MCPTGNILGTRFPGINSTFVMEKPPTLTGKFWILSNSTNYCLTRITVPCVGRALRRSVSSFYCDPTKVPVAVSVRLLRNGIRQLPGYGNACARGHPALWNPMQFTGGLSQKDRKRMKGRNTDFCSDLRGLNQVSVGDKFPLPSCQ